MKPRQIWPPCSSCLITSKLLLLNLLLRKWRENSRSSLPPSFEKKPIRTELNCGSTDLQFLVRYTITQRLTIRVSSRSDTVSHLLFRNYQLKMTRTQFRFSIQMNYARTLSSSLISPQQEVQLQRNDAYSFDKVGHNFSTATIPRIEVTLTGFLQSVPTWIERENETGR